MAMAVGLQLKVRARIAKITLVGKYDLIIQAPD